MLQEADLIDAEMIWEDHRLSTEDSSVVEDGAPRLRPDPGVEDSLATTVSALPCEPRGAAIPHQRGGLTIEAKITVY